MVRLLIIALCYSLFCQHACAQEDSLRHVWDKDTLVFEDSESIWPYTFLDEQGQPQGYCIDLIDLLMKELNIPYVVHLKNHQEVLRDLKEGRADLILGLGDVYETKFGYYSQSTITLLTQSVATPKGKPVAVKNFRDLKNQQVIVKDSGLCHHLMMDYGWGKNAIVTHDVAKAIKEVNNKREGQVVWNTLTLKWLIDHYQLENLVLTPVNMPHGETKFLATNQQLLDLIDQTYTKLSMAGRLQPLEEKWFYPNREKPKPHFWLWIVVSLAAILLLAALGFMVLEIRYNMKMTRRYGRLAYKLSMLAKHNNMRFWTYRVADQKFTWRDDQGKPVKTYSADDFAKRYDKDDYSELLEALDRLAMHRKDDKGHERVEETLELKAKDPEVGDAFIHNFVVHLSMFSSDSRHQPTTIIAAKKDVTKEHCLQKENAERSLCYLSMFFNDDSGILFFNKHGNLMNANPRAGELLECDIDEMVKQRMFLNKLLQTVYTNFSETDGKGGTLRIGEKMVKYHMKAVYGDYNELLGIFVFCV